MRLAIVLATLSLLLIRPGVSSAAVINLSGEVRYFGSYSGEALYVAALDTAGTGEATLLNLKTYFPVSLPFAQPYTLTFDNTGVSAQIAIVSFLDVDGGGISDISGADVFGWYAGTNVPSFVPTGSSLTGLNFDLPLAEIHGTITFQTDQYEARVDITNDLSCGMEGFRPRPTITSGGAYSVVGLYAGSYCIRGEGSTPTGTIYVCHGDPECVTPTTVILGTTTIRTGVDLDFDALVATEPTTWSRFKSGFR